MACAQVALKGRVVDEHEAPVGGACVSMRRGQEAAIETYTGPSGAFQVSLPGTGGYLLDVDRTGYFQVHDRRVLVESGQAEVTVVLNPQREVFQSVTVGGWPTP